MFVKRLIALRREHALLRPASFHSVRSRAFRCDGLAARGEDFSDYTLRTLALWLEPGEAGGSGGPGLLVLLNTGLHDQRFTLPRLASTHFRHLLDTHQPARERGTDVLAAGGSVRVAAHSLRVFEEVP